MKIKAGKSKVNIPVKKSNELTTPIFAPNCAKGMLKDTFAIVLIV